MIYKEHKGARNSQRLAWEKYQQDGAGVARERVERKVGTWGDNPHMLRNWRATEQRKAGNRSRQSAFLRNIKDCTKLYSANIKHPGEQKAASTAGTNARKRQKGLRQLEPFQNNPLRKRMNKNKLDSVGFCKGAGKCISVKRRNASQGTKLGQGLGYKRSIISHEPFDLGSRGVWMVQVGLWREDLVGAGNESLGREKRGDLWCDMYISTRDVYAPLLFPGRRSGLSQPQCKGSVQSDSTQSTLTWLWNRCRQDDTVEFLSFLHTLWDLVNVEPSFLNLQSERQQREKSPHLKGMPSRASCCKLSIFCVCGRARKQKRPRMCHAHCRGNWSIKNCHYNPHSSSLGGK